MHTALCKPGFEGEKPPLVDRELTVREMLADEIVIRLMERDGVTRAQVVEVFMTARRVRLCRAA